MRNFGILLSTLLMASVSHLSASAATVSLFRSTREVTSEEIAGGAPVGGLVHDFFINADTDILSFNQIEVDVPLFQAALGSDSFAPSAVLAGISPGITADSFLTTPGSTTMLGGGFGQGGDRLWGDLSDDGPQQGFHFARLTVGQTGSFTGRVAVRSPDAPVYLPFSFTLPGNMADMALLAAEPTYSREYSLDPTPPYVPPAPVNPPPYVPPAPIDPPPSVPPIVPPAPNEPPVMPPPISNPGGGPMAKLSIARQSRAVTPDEIAGGAPSGGFVHEFFVTTDTDILSVNKVNIDVPLYEHALGADNAAPAQPIVDMMPSLAADSFIQMPSDTVMLGGGVAGAGEKLWGDLSNDGGQENFLFARLTVDQTGTFGGNVSVRTDTDFVSLPFEFLLPGTESDMALLASEPAYSREYSLQPPAPPTIPEPNVEPPSPSPIEPPPTPPDGTEPLEQAPGQEPPPAIDPPPTPPTWKPRPDKLVYWPNIDTTMSWRLPIYTIDLVDSGAVVPSIDYLVHPDLISNPQEFTFDVDHDAVLTGFAIEDGAALGTYFYSMNDVGTSGTLELTGSGFANYSATELAGYLSRFNGTSGDFGPELASAHIPEPSAAALLGAGLLALFAVRRRSDC